VKENASQLLDEMGVSHILDLVVEEGELYLVIKEDFLAVAKDSGFQLQENKISLVNQLPKIQKLVRMSARHGKETEQNEFTFSYWLLRSELLLSLAGLTKNTNLEEFFDLMQSRNVSHIQLFQVKNFFAIEELTLEEIKGAKEVYFLGENGNGKSLVLMALHLAFNGRHIASGTNLEFTGKISEIIKANPEAYFHGRDMNGIVYGSGKGIFLQNFFAYGVHRGRYTGDEGRFEQYGFMSLYDPDLQLYSPEELLKQTYILELENQVQQNQATSKLKNSPNWVTVNSIQQLFQEVLENNLEIKVSAQKIEFIEKGFSLSFSQLSEGYKNMMIWLSDLIYRFRNNEPNIGRFEDFKGIVLVDEIELHLHPRWQRQIIGKLRKFFPQIQFIFTTHSPTIIQGASDDAVIYRVFRDGNTGKTYTSDAYFKKDLNHLMLNTLATSPLFGLEDARMSQEVEEVDTSDSYVHSRVAKQAKEQLEKQKKEGKSFISEKEVDDLIDDIFENE